MKVFGNLKLSYFTDTSENGTPIGVVANHEKTCLGRQ